MMERARASGAALSDCASWVARIVGASLALCCSTSSSTATPTPAPVPEREPSPVTACGSKGLPDCPLQGWMKATLQAYLTAGDTVRLAAALDELGRHAPDGFANWSATAQAGADAARAGDVAKVRAQCQSCHGQHRTAFRQQLRTARLF